MHHIILLSIFSLPSPPPAFVSIYLFLSWAFSLFSPVIRKIFPSQVDVKIKLCFLRFNIHTSLCGMPLFTLLYQIMRARNYEQRINSTRATYIQKRCLHLCVIIDISLSTHIIIYSAVCIVAPLFNFHVLFTIVHRMKPIQEKIYVVVVVVNLFEWKAYLLSTAQNTSSFKIFNFAHFHYLLRLKNIMLYRMVDFSQFRFISLNIDLALDTYADSENWMLKTCHLNLIWNLSFGFSSNGFNHWLIAPAKWNPFRI